MSKPFSRRSPAADLKQDAHPQPQNECDVSANKTWRQCLIGLGAVLCLFLSACGFEEISEAEYKESFLPEDLTEEQRLLLANAEIVKCDSYDDEIDVEIEFTNPLDVRIDLVVFDVDIQELFTVTTDISFYDIAPGQTARESWPSRADDASVIPDCVITNVTKF